MKIKIKSIAKREMQTRFGTRDNLSIVNEHDGITYTTFWNPVVGSWKVGQEVETEVKQNGKFWNIVTPKDNPRQSYSPQASELSEAIKSQLDRIERKLDKLLDAKQTYAFVPPTGTVTLTPANIPYADSPHPEDKDIPY